MEHCYGARVPPDSRHLKSTASTPSLRSRKSEVIDMEYPHAENVAANVRVVVRVRGFLPRGKTQNSVLNELVLM